MLAAHLQPPPPSLGAVTLREVTKKNYEEVMDLRPAPDQQRFVATNAESLADMHFADGARCCECSLLRERAADVGLESETPTSRSESDRCRVASLVTGAVYAGDTPVGFVMLATEVDEETLYAQYYLWRWMIDQRHQVNTLAGSGRAAAYCQA
jgi:diamine N-acetyltransferase